MRKRCLWSLATLALAACGLVIFFQARGLSGDQQATPDHPAGAITPAARLAAANPLNKAPASRSAPPADASAGSSTATAQHTPAGTPAHLIGHNAPLARTIDEIPPSPFREALLRLDRDPRAKALRQFNELRIPMADVASLHVSSDGMLYYACAFGCEHPGHLHAAATAQTDSVEADPAPESAGASVPISNPPVFNSRPGAPYAIYLDFNGATISGTQWNATYNSGNTLEARPWSKDSDLTTFSDDEQAIIRRIWQRVAEDYAPFNVNVTTDPAYDPDATGGRNDVGWILFTRDVDANGVNMPAKGAGGVAYINVFGRYDYASRYQPAFIYANNLGPNVEHFMAEAGSHEMGHNLGLSHDGNSSTEYYPGHGSGETKWSPIMGSSYFENVTTWSKGEYFGANNLQDDLAIIAGKIKFRPGDHGNTITEATPLTLDGNSILNSSTLDFVGDDPNEGIISSPDDLDVFSFETGGGNVRIAVNTFLAEDRTYSRGNNLDVKLTLFDADGAVLTVVDPSTTVAAALDTSLAAGRYFLGIEGTGSGSPMGDPPSGYTSYGSLGMYFISGEIPQPIAVTQPADGAVLEPGKPFTIAWSGSTPGDSVDLELHQAGVPVGTIASGLDGALGGFEWLVPEDLPQGGEFSVRMTLNSDPLSSAESGIFSIQLILPYVTAQMPTADQQMTSPQGELALTFSEPMDTASFSIAEDISSFTGPQGVDISSLISGAAWDATGTILTLFFEPQASAGYYRMVIGPDVLDLDGNAMDQDGDGIPGQLPEDTHVAFFQVSAPPMEGRQVLFSDDMTDDPGSPRDSGWEWGAPAQGAVGGPDAAFSGTAVLGYNLSGRYEPGLNPPRRVILPAVNTIGMGQIQLNFQRWLGVAYLQTGAPSGRHADYARIHFSTDGITWVQLWANAGEVSDSGWTAQQYSLPASAENTASLYLRFEIESDGDIESFGWNIDDLVVTGMPTSPSPAALPPPPVVTGHSPEGSVAGPRESLYIEFSQPMDTTSFALSDIGSFDGPEGPIAAIGLEWISSSILRIDFPEQTTGGAYSLLLNPTITDELGQPLDQDRDLVPGEPVEDAYLASFSIDTGFNHSPAEDWRLFYFGYAENAGDAADNSDFDKDGVVNIIERAFGTDPTEGSSAYRPAQFLVDDGGAFHLALSYRRIAGGSGATGVDYTADGLTYTVEYAVELDSVWNSGDITVVEISDPVDGFETVTVRLNTPLSPGVPAFVRLRVSSVDQPL
jgi:hypothetical protein